MAARPGQAGATLLARGDLANLYLTGDDVRKVTRRPEDNDLMDREAVALAGLAAGTPAGFGAYFPVLLRTERRPDPRTGAERRANVLAGLPGFVTLGQVRRAYPAGLDPRDAAWMWRRLLSGLGAAHRAGLVHGAVLPEHVLIHPGQHGLVLVDWCYSGPPGAAAARAGRPLPELVPARSSGRPARRAGHRHLARHPVPDRPDRRAPACARSPPSPAAAPLASPRRRPQDAWALLAELDDLLARLYGPRRFRPFAMPG